jgi:hypothetical protein
MKIDRALLAATSAIAVIACAAPANAAGSPAPAAWTLKIGEYTSLGQNAGSPFQIALGLDYRLDAKNLAAPAATSVYADFLGISSTTNSSYGSGFGVAYRSTGKAFIGAGIGLYSASITPAFAGSAGQSGARTISASGPGGKLFAGLSFGSNLEIEAAYHILPSAAPGVGSDGATVELGARF